MLTRIKSFLLIFSLFTGVELSAEPLRPVFSLWSLEVGSSHLADTYLSPIKYSGQHYSLGWQRRQSMRFDPERWTNGLRINLNLDRALNPTHNYVMWGAELNAGWSMTRYWHLDDGVTLGVGGGTDLAVGALLLNRSSNNPVQANASLTLAPELYASKRIQIKRFPFTLGAKLAFPVVGAFFCPDYGQLYYEIALGNRSNLLHAAWPGNFRRLTAELYVDFRPGSTLLRLGYKFDGLSTRANNITSRSLTHAAVIAIGGEWLSVNPSKNNDAKIISACY